MGAKEVTPEQAPGLHAMIERLCIQADLPKPRIAVADTAMPNAFAMGRSQKNATVCATTAIMRTLSPAELEAVFVEWAQLGEVLVGLLEVVAEDLVEL